MLFFFLCRNRNPVIGRAINNISAELLRLIFLTNLPEYHTSHSVRRILGESVPAGFVGGLHAPLVLPWERHVAYEVRPRGRGPTSGYSSASNRHWQRWPRAMRVLPRVRARPSSRSESPKAGDTVIGSLPAAGQSEHTAVPTLFTATSIGLLFETT